MSKKLCPNECGQPAGHDGWCDDSKPVAPIVKDGPPTADDEVPQLDDLLMEDERIDYKETTKAELQDATVNNMEPAPKRVKKDPKKLYRQVGGIDSPEQPQNTALVPKGRKAIGMEPYHDLDRVFWGIGLIVVATLLLFSGRVDALWTLIPLLGIAGVTSDWEVVNGPRTLPPKTDFVVYSNEDYGFIADMVATTNQVYAFSMPYPAGMNLFTQTIEVYQADFMYVTFVSGINNLISSGFDLYMSMLDKEFAAVWDGVLDDDEDERFKAHFEGPLFLGQLGGIANGAGQTLPYWYSIDTMKRGIRWYPPTEKMRLTTPWFIQYVAHTFTVTLGTGAIVHTGAFTDQEKCPIRMWYKVKDLNAEERGFRNEQLLWQILNS